MNPEACSWNTAEMPDAVIHRIAPHFGLALTGEDEHAMRQRAREDAKNPTVPFVPDAAEQRAIVPPGMRRLAGELIEPLYRELSSFATSQRRG